MFCIIAQLFLLQTRSMEKKNKKIKNLNLMRCTTYLSENNLHVVKYWVDR